MATAWNVFNKGRPTAIGGGPNWEVMSTSTTHDYDQLDDQLWNWANDWPIVGVTTSASATLWSNANNTWITDPYVWRKDVWLIYANTKVQEATET